MAAGPDILLKFQQELSGQAEKYRAHLESLTRTLFWLVVLASGLFAALGFRTWWDIRKRATIWSRKYTQDVVDNRIDEYITQQTRRIEKTRKKLTKGIENINEAVIAAFPTLVTLYAGSLEKAKPRLLAKRLLWVDDDEPGVNLFVRIVRACGVEVQLTPTTGSAVKEFRQRAHHLVVTNMMRDDDPCEPPAGITLVKELRACDCDSRSIIFTKPDHAHLRDRATEAGAASFCTTPEDLFQAIARLLLDETA